MLDPFFSALQSCAIYHSSLALILSFGLEVIHILLNQIYSTNTVISAIIGVSLSAATLPLPGYMAKIMNKIQVERMKKVTDQISLMYLIDIAHPRQTLEYKLLQKVRKSTAETSSYVPKFLLVMSVIRMMKLFGWETKVNNLITEKRDAELALIKKRKLVNLINVNLK